jgi:hypothetical protein
MEEFDSEKRSGRLYGSIPSTKFPSSCIGYAEQVPKAQQTRHAHGAKKQTTLHLAELGLMISA